MMYHVVFIKILGIYHEFFFSKIQKKIILLYITFLVDFIKKTHGQMCNEKGRTQRGNFHDHEVARKRACEVLLITKSKNLLVINNNNHF